ncbi:hypothetical protein MaudCBS49596_000471 [Microsporum audouinii]
MSQPKGMSSRLLTMKFMQRAAASGVSSSSSPVQTPPDSPSSRKRVDDTSSPSSKRRKISGDSPSQKAVAPANNSDMKAISAAIQAEDNKRSAAIARQAADAGETQWVLEYPVGTIKSAAHRTSTAKSKLDNDADDEPTCEGRKSYGGFKKKRQVEAPEPPELPKPDTNTGSVPRAQLKHAVKTGRISSGGISANSGTNSHKGKNWKNKQ